jgi:hypothetical protein
METTRVDNNTPTKPSDANITFSEWLAASGFATSI